MTKFSTKYTPLFFSGSIYLVELELAYATTGFMLITISIVKIEGGGNGARFERF